MVKEVSVVIPVLNEEESIEGNLNCFLNQTQNPLEIIIVDNGSKDRTKKIVLGFKKKFSKKGISLRILSCPYGNQTNARALGIKKAKGSIIGSLDAEAYPNSKWVAQIKSCLADSKVVGIGGKSRFRNKGKLFNFFYLFNYFFRKAINLYCIGGGNSAFRKSAFLKVKGYEGLEGLRKKENINYAKDDFFLSKKLEKKGKLKFCQDLKVTLLYRIRNKKNKVYKKKIQFKEVIKRAYLELKYDYKIRKHFKEYKN
jgi:glycosyltransferase involved in cell wall biosynthesis